MFRIIVVSVVALLSACQTGSTGHVHQAPGAAPVPRTISVTGQAEIKTAPDEFAIVVGVQSFAKALSEAKADNDTRASEVLVAIEGFGVDAKDVRTEDFRIQPRYDGRYDRRVFVGYDVTKRIAVVLRDGSKLEDLLAALFERGANVLHGVTFQSSKAIEKRKEARLEAVRAAREKAEAMAAALGQDLGRPVSISTLKAGGGFGPSPLNNFAIDNDTSASVSETMATGKIKVSATVTVVFELVDP